MSSRILILDCGSQYTQLIARRVREQKVFCEVLSCQAPFAKIRKFSPQALILSGGPSSVYDPDAPKISKEILKMGVPILGICYGMQWLSHQLGGKVEPGKTREYGPATISVLKHGGIFAEWVDAQSLVWMSHGDHVTRLPVGFEQLASSGNHLVAAIGHTAQKIYGLQFHPEVVHTPQGTALLKNFLFTVAGLKPDWSMSSFVETKTREIQNFVGKGQGNLPKVLAAVSGGVDSTVMAALIHRAVGDQLQPIFIDNGLLRKGEFQKVQDAFKKHMGIHLIAIDASKRFLQALRGVSDPEKKRKIIGHEFIKVFEAEAKKLKGIRFLAQGTLYPDVIESVSFRGPSVTIKSHHNVGGLPKKMKLKLVEPFRELFKDEVREIGRILQVPEELIGRHPFPGPGLAIRVLDKITEASLNLLREADEVILNEFKKSGWYHKVWQAFGVLLPVKSVGVMGDGRTYENVLALRVVESLDGMTANWVRVPYELLEKISSRIINQVRGINRVVYDISSKPPATIEWE